LRKKSVEDLEQILSNRWGTNLASFTAEDWDDDEEEDDDDYDDSGSGGNTRHGNTATRNASSPIFRGRPVVDPWSKITPSQRKEYYDVDDEGYNKEGGDLDHLIAPRPAGASGRTKTNFNDGGYFLRRPPPQNVEPKIEDEEDQLHKPDAPKKADRQRIAPERLLNKDGKPMLLSILQAEQLFREQLVGHETSKLVSETVDNKAEDEDLEEELSPLVTFTAQSNPQWSDIGVTETVLLENLKAIGCATPLPVQQNASPAILDKDRDIVIGTYTGSGKTLAFLVPLLQKLLEEKAQPNDLSVLIVAPGRELASQIVSVARELSRNTPYTSQLAIGGTTFSRNLQTIRQKKPTILVGTPGRLAELIVGKPGEKGGRLKLPNARYLVLDEFDALLEYKPHREPTQALIQRMRRNPHLRSILCSATATDVLESPKLERCIRPDYFLAMSDRDDIFVTASANDRGDSFPRVSRTVMHGVVHVPHRRFVIETIRRILHTEPIPQQIVRTRLN
jgi:hypothetical protein